MNEFMIDMAFDEMPVSGCTCLSTLSPRLGVAFFFLRAWASSRTSFAAMVVAEHNSVTGPPYYPHSYHAPCTSTPSEVAIGSQRASPPECLASCCPPPPPQPPPMSMNMHVIDGARLTEGRVVHAAPPATVAAEALGVAIGGELEVGGLSVWARAAPSRSGELFDKRHRPKLRLEAVGMAREPIGAAAAVERLRGPLAASGAGWRLGQLEMLPIASLKARRRKNAAGLEPAGGSGSGGTGYTSEKWRLSSENSPMVHGWHGLPSSMYSNW